MPGTHIAARQNLPACVKSDRPTSSIQPFPSKADEFSGERFSSLTTAIDIRLLPFTRNSVENVSLVLMAEDVRRKTKFDLGC